MAYKPLNSRPVHIVLTLPSASTSSGLSSGQTIGRPTHPHVIVYRRSTSKPADSPTEMTSDDHPKRDFRFWLVMLGICVATMMTGLELSAVSTALPRIVHDLGGDEFVWVGSAYTLAASAFIPLTGGLAQIFGRRPVMLAALIVMSVGAALCGAANSMNFLIAGRTVQGLGGGAIASMTAIIMADLVPLRERGVFNGLLGIAFSISSGVGPIVGGALAQSGSKWRWLFYLNIPFCGASAVLILLFLRVNTPPGTLLEKISKVDWIGTVLIIGSTTAIVMALTWSGIQYAWSSVHVLVPLILGLAGLLIVIVYETLVPTFPLIPFSLMSTRTAAAGYIQNFISQLVQISIIYYVPVYFQACKGLSPIAAGVKTLSLALVVGPVGIMAGASVNKTQHYRPQLWLSWVFLMVAVGLFTLLRADTSIGETVGFLIIGGIGLGLLATTTYFPVLAPVPVNQAASAMAFFMFLRNFAQVWGITIGGTVLQNQLQKHMPAAFLQKFPQGSEIAYSAIPIINSLPETLQREIRVAFAQSLKVIWQVYVGIAGIGVLASLLMKHMPLHTSTDKDWALQEEDEKDMDVSASA